jgi:hypothetical protein
MKQVDRSLRRLVVLLSLLFVFEALAFGQASNFVNSLTVPGNTADLTALSSRAGAANLNRLGGFGSDLFYDQKTGFFYGLADRGPGGGTIAYDTRVQKFRLTVDPHTGAISNFRLVETIFFTLPSGKNVNGISGPLHFNGLDPELDAPYGSDNRLGRSFDPEGFVVAPNGHFYVSDEYGPSVYEFRPDGSFVRAFAPPSNLLPHEGSSSAQPYFSALNAGMITRGRQSNRGFEGLAIGPDGRRLFAMLQDPLAEEGAGSNDRPGRFSRNLRLVVYDTRTGRSVAQYVYQLEELNTINARVPDNPFQANSQGISIGVSALAAISDHEFLVLERDNRGFGVADVTGATPPVSTKRIYRIDLNGATNLIHPARSGPPISLAGTNRLPVGVIPVRKTLFLDMLAALTAAGLKSAEKLEGLAVGPRLDDGTYALIVGSDNDFSVTQNDSNTQFDVCTDGRQVPLDSGCAPGGTLIPTFFYSFKSASNQADRIAPSPSAVRMFEPLKHP